MGVVRFAVQRSTCTASTARSRADLRPLQSECELIVDLLRQVERRPTAPTISAITRTDQSVSCARRLMRVLSGVSASGTAVPCSTRSLESAALCRRLRAIPDRDAPGPPAPADRSGRLPASVFPRRPIAKHLPLSTAVPRAWRNSATGWAGSGTESPSYSECVGSRGGTFPPDCPNNTIIPRGRRQFNPCI